MSKAKEILDAITKTYVGLMPYSLVVTLAVAAGIILAIFLWYLFSDSVSPNENAAMEANSNTIVANTSTNVQQQEVEHLEESVEQAEKSRQNAQKQRDKAKNTNTANSSYAEANRERCLTFPNSPECK